MAPRGQWPEAPVIYQIYPRSFQDSTGTGEGDLLGIIRRLDHIADLGVDAIWLSPFFNSPMMDGGYDVTCFREIDPRFGTDQDFDALIAAAHERHLLVMIDQVLNHTSDQHHWFQRAIDGDEEAAARYVWLDPKPDGTAPNNWLSQFGPPAWTWNHRRRQYYMHQFLSAQPSLNLRNPDVKASHRETIRYWRGRGVDGFRFDAVTAYLFNPEMTDNPPASQEVQDRVSGENFVPYTYQDHVHDLLPGDGAAYTENLRRWAGDDALLLGESTSGNKSIELVLEFTGPERLDGCYTTDLVEGRLDAQAVKDVLDRLGGRPVAPWWLSSHDQKRHASRAGDGSDRDIRFLATVMACLPGTWLIYQGEELGLPQPELSKAETTDPLDLLYWPDGPGREGARVPLPWTEEPDRFGFTAGKPWLPMRWSKDLSATAQAHQGSLPFYRSLIENRKRHRWSTARIIDCSAEDDVLRLSLGNDDRRYLLAANFGTEAAARPDAITEELVFASEPLNETLPPRCAAVWRRR